MVSASDCSTPERERLSWLTCLISSYKAEHDWEADEDPTASREMLREVCALADELERQLPKPLASWVDSAGVLKTAEEV